MMRPRSALSLEDAFPYGATKTVATKYRCNIRLQGQDAYIGRLLDGLVRRFAARSCRYVLSSTAIDCALESWSNVARRKSATRRKTRYRAALPWMHTYSLSSRLGHFGQHIALDDRCRDRSKRLTSSSCGEYAQVIHMFCSPPDQDFSRHAVRSPLNALGGSRSFRVHAYGARSHQLRHRCIRIQSCNRFKAGRMMHEQPLCWRPRVATMHLTAHAWGSRFLGSPGQSCQRS